MFQAKSKKKGKPAAVHSKSTSSVISDLSNPSGSDDSEHDEISIPDAIEERSFSEENPSSHTRDVKDSDKSKSDKSKRSKKKSKNAEKDDNDSDGESSIKSDGVSKKRKKRKKKKKQQLNDLRESEDEDLFEENEALQEEVISLRRKMNLRGDAMEMIQLQMDLKRAVNEASELKSEIDEYEEAVSEKDGLIKKLTEAVDCQLDKVEYLELKLQRAEDEFVKMEDEMKEMEDEIEDLKEGSQAGSVDGQLAGDNKGELEDREHKLEDRENSLLVKEQELLDRERDLVDREEELEIQDEKLSDQRDDLRMKELQFEEREREAIENQQITYGGSGGGYELEEKQQEINTLKKNVALKTGEVHELRGQLSRPGSVDFDVASDVLKEENDMLKKRIAGYEAVEREMQESRDEEIRGIQLGADEQMQKRLDQNESLKRQIEALKLESINSDIHKELNKKDEFAQRQQEEIDQVWRENETLKDEVKNLSSRLKKAETELAETKASCDKKMKQKDETVDFMQGEMVRLTMEKKLVGIQTMSSGSPEDEEAEMMRLKAFNDQIRVLDEMNRDLESKLKQARSDHDNELKEKDSRILELEEDVEDLQLTIKTDNGDAGIDTLKSGKEERKKKELKRIKTELKESKKRISELETEIGEMKKKVGEDFEHQIKSLEQTNEKLERKLKAENDESAQTIRLRDEKINLLEQELEEQKDGGGAFGLFSKKKVDKTVGSPKPAGKGLWGALLKPPKKENESKFDRNKRENMVRQASPRHLYTENPEPAFAPIITGQQSIEDELRDIEDQARKYEEPKITPESKKEIDHLSGSVRITMTGELRGPGFENDATDSVEESESMDSLSSRSSESEDTSSDNSPIENSPARMNIASRLEEMRAKRHMDESGGED